MGKMTEFLKKSMKKSKGSTFVIIVEAKEGKVQQARRKIRGVGASVLSVSGDFIRVRVPNKNVARKIAQIPSVENVSKETYVKPMASPLDKIYEAIGIKQDPLLSEMSQKDREDLGIHTKPAAVLPKATTSFLQPKLPLAPHFIRGGKEWVIVTTTRKIINAPEDNKLSGDTKTCVIDSGLGTPAAGQHPAFRGRYDQLSLTAGPPSDNMGHGTHVSTCAWGSETPSPYGSFKPVAEAKKESFLHIKVFSAVGGASNFQIMKAMDIAAKRGMDIVNMSLGGPVQDNVLADPLSKKAKKMKEKYGTNYIVAAGNDGPDDWTISTPGISPWVLTVGSIGVRSLEVSEFSSRGPQGKYYKDHRSEYRSHLNRFGQALVKPDVVAPGGTRDRQIVSGVSGWYDGFYDLSADLFEMMTGTSQATPHVTGLVSLLLDRGKIEGIEDVKSVMRRKGHRKNRDSGYGILSWEKF